MQAIMKKRFKLLRNQKGMTLIELLAVVVILGVIAAIAVPAIAGTISNTKTKADDSSKTIIGEAAYRYFMDQDPTGKNVTSGATTITVGGLQGAGYISSSFNAASQVDGTKSFKNITGTYSSTTGWSIAVDNPAP